MLTSVRYLVVDSHLLMQIFQGRYIPDLYDLYDLYDLAHVAGWEPHNLNDLGRVSWAGSVLYRSCTAYYNGRLGSRLSTMNKYIVICAT